MANKEISTLSALGALIPKKCNLLILKSKCLGSHLRYDIWMKILVFDSWSNFLQLHKDETYITNDRNGINLRTTKILRKIE